MHHKDHYGTLGIGTSATLPEIKKAYRKLAQQYHPDKNPEDPYAAAQFAEIKEAYEVLTDPSKKEYYLQQRWYDQHIGKRKKETIITPATVITQVVELEKYVSKLDHFRMDKAGLHDYIAGLMSDSTIEKLNGFNEPLLNGKIIELLLNCLNVLPLAYLLPLHEQLIKLNIDVVSQERLSNFITTRQRTLKRERYTVSLMLLITDRKSVV